MKNILLCLYIILFIINVSTAQFEFFSPRNEKHVPGRYQKLGEPIPEISHYFDEAMLDSFILEMMNQHNMPGLAACVLNDGQVVWHNNYGYANIAQNKPVTDSTLFRIASISKTITATALMRLWEKGLFQLNEEINPYLPPELQVHHPSYPQDPITFEMLLTHTSGINDYWPTLYSLVVQGDSPIPLDSFLIHYLTPGGNYYNQYQNFQYQPGTEFDYCNVGYGLLAYLVERISGIPFPQYCQQNIFTPLNMNHASWFLSGTDTNNVAMPYEMINNIPVAFGHYGSPNYPAGQIRINTLELANFLGTYMNGGSYSGYTLLDSTTIDTMLTRRVFYPQSNAYYGLGWWQDCYHGPWLWGHIGGWIGCSTEMFFHPTEKYGFISFINCDDDENLWIIDGEICNFAYLWDKIYPIKSRLFPEPHYMRPGIDSIQVTTRFVNHSGDPFNCHAVFISTDSTYLDSIPLFDDGLHGDGSAGDGLWGNYNDPIPEENYFEVRISTNNQVTGEYFLSEAVANFTTVGRLVVNHYEIPQKNQNSFQLRLFLKNEGLTATVSNVTTKISTNDTNVTNIVPDIQTFGSLTPGQVVASNGVYYIFVQNNPNSINFSVNISSEGYHFWNDSFKVDLITGISGKNNNIPNKYSLNQNYANPFNPRTTIAFDLPKTGQVVLKIFNILGQEVETLVSDRLSAGSYKYRWDASHMASGVYLYRLEAEGFVQTRKMLLVK